MMQSCQLDSPGAAVLLHDDSPGVLRRLIELQTRLSYGFDRLLPKDYQVDGNRDFIARVVPAYPQHGMRIYDVGGGKNPVIDVALKTKLSLSTVGLDIDPAELDAAPAGSYDQTICADIATYHGNGDADLVICQALLEHIPCVEGALRAIASILKPGGLALLFVPSRNAVYARINLALPQRLKRHLLRWIFPKTSRDHGFPAYYDRCTSAGIEKAASKHGLVCERLCPYFQSDYFRFCFPLHVAWRLWLLLFRTIDGVQAAETFSMVLRKEGA
jgi:SAM-dependent methyltransferase